MVDPPRSPALAAIETLDPGECRALLARQRLCTLSLVDGAAPYAVPLFYGWDGASLYLGIAEGRKSAVLDANPAVCLTIVEVHDADRWASVQVTGRAETLSDPAARESAVQVLVAHNRRLRGPAEAVTSGTSPRRHAGGRIVRVADAVIAGRIRR